MYFFVFTVFFYHRFQAATYTRTPIAKNVASSSDPAGPFVKLTRCRMKNKNRSRKIHGQLVDFIIYILLLTLIIGGILFLSRLLYGNTSEQRVIRMETELIPDIHSGKLSEGDPVFDTVSKRMLGTVKDLFEERCGDNIRYRFTVEAVSEPRGRALRTARLWFYFKEIEA